MKCDERTVLRQGSLGRARLLATAFALLTACSQSDADKDGSQTHFGNRGEDGGEATPPATAQGTTAEDTFGTTTDGTSTDSAPDDPTDTTAASSTDAAADSIDEESAPAPSSTEGTDTADDAAHAEPDGPDAGSTPDHDAGLSVPTDTATTDAGGSCVIGTQCAARPLCSATSFESTNDGCLEQSWRWDGDQCSVVEHCGCAGGDCDRLYPDEGTCLSAHAACVPAGCESQDARSGALMCGTVEGYSFRGWQCEAVLCQCSGADCEEITATSEECESRYAHCMERSLPACVDPIFPVLGTDPGYDPNYPSFDISVEGYDELIDPERGDVAVFAEWTAAQWLGWEEGAEPEFCVPITPGRFLLTCPSTRPLLLQVGDDVVQVNITLHWDGLALETVTPSNVEVRLSEHPSGSLMFEVRDAADQAPILVVVKGQADRAGSKEPWTFGPFTVNAGAARCMTSPDACNWTFSALDLDVAAPGTTFTLPPQGSKRVSVDGNDFAVLYGYILEQATVTDDACGVAKSWHQNFALLQIPAEE